MFLIEFTSKFGTEVSPLFDFGQEKSLLESVDKIYLKKTRFYCVCDTNLHISCSSSWLLNCFPLSSSEGKVVQKLEIFPPV